jgi:molybdenum-dependent DNA-binding transcriptional regulator ModE
LPSADHRKQSLRLKRSYVQVENEKRLLLVDLVNQNQCTIKAAAKQLGINYSTAKHIYKQHSLSLGDF